MIVPNSEVTIDKWIVSEKDKMTVAPNFTITGHISGVNIAWDK